MTDHHRDSDGADVGVDTHSEIDVAAVLDELGGVVELRHVRHDRRRVTTGSSRLGADRRPVEAFGIEGTGSGAPDCRGSCGEDQPCWK